MKVKPSTIAILVGIAVIALGFYVFYSDRIVRIG